MRHRRALLAGIAACATALAAPAWASAETVTYTTPGLTTVTLPPGVPSIHVVVVGARGGGLQGGYGAVVTADFDLATPSGLANQVRVFIGGNGAVGAAGANGGGAPPFPSLAAGGGGWSGVSPCTVMVGGNCRLFLRALVAAGGGGAGADGLPGTGGAGGSAGAPGGSGSSTALLAAASGGGTGTAFVLANGGSGGVSSDPDCDDGDPGEEPTTGLGTAGGTGGVSGALDGHGDGGGGGGGSPSTSGGGGGAGAWCIDDTGASGGGGGGGGSTVPSGGQLASDTTGQPSVTISYEPQNPQPQSDPPLPSATISAPSDGAVYAQGSRVKASYSCSPSSALPGTTIASCTGTLPIGQRIDMHKLGHHSFSVEAVDSLGHTATSTVGYEVTDQTRPAIHGLQLAPSAIDPTAKRPFTTVAFRLSESARVLIGIRSVGARAARTRRSRPRAPALAGHAGRNTFRLHARIGRRTLGAGEYRLVLVAVDAAGNRSRPVGARFRVLG